MQFNHQAVTHEVEDPDLLRRLMRDEARRRKLRIRTGTATHAQSVCAVRADKEMEFLQPHSEEERERTREAIKKRLGDVRAAVAHD